jgi:hypothetical protein
MWQYQHYYLQDTQLGLGLDPLPTLSTLFSVWSGANIGQPASQNPTVLLPYGSTLGILAWLGVSNIYIQHIWIALILCSSGIGMYYLTAVLSLKRYITACLIAGISYEFSSYVIVMLPGTTLWFVSYALLPYEVMLAIRISRRPESSVGLAILLGILVGGIPTVNLVPWLLNIAVLITTVIHAVAIHGTSLRRLFRPLLVVSMTALPMLAWWLLPQLAGLLYDTTQVKGLLAAEGPAMYDQASSFLNSFRQLGLWALYSGFNGLPYFRFAPQYLSDQGIAIASYGQALFCFVPLLTRYARLYSQFALVALISLAMMVGAYPLTHLTFQGGLYLLLYGHVPLFAVFRDGYKFAALLAFAASLGLGLSFGLLVDHIRRVGAVWSHHLTVRVFRSMGAVTFLAIVGGLFLIGQPLWSGQEYNSSQLLPGLPRYWTAVQTYLRKQAGFYNVLVLPLQYFPVYTWGRPVTDILDTQAYNYNYVSEIAASELYGNPNLHLLFDAVNSRSPRRLAQLLQLLGISYIVNRYDIDTAYYPGTLQPADVSALLSRTPDVKITRRFGPVEVYRVQGYSPLVGVMPDAAVTRDDASTDDLLKLSQKTGAALTLTISPAPTRGTTASAPAKWLQIPRAGRYHIIALNLATVATDMTVSLDGMQLHAPSSQHLYWWSDRYLRNGVHTVSFGNKGVAARPQAGSRWIVWATPVGQTSSPHVDISRLSGAVYRVRFPPTQKSLVVFLNQTYSSGWQVLPLRWPELLTAALRALVHPASADHWVANGHANAWLISGHSSDVLLVYAPELYFVLGSFISATALAVSIYWGLRQLRSRRPGRASTVSSDCALTRDSDP